jgi:hypothetical protein
MGLHILSSKEAVQIGAFFISRYPEYVKSFISSPSAIGSFWKTATGGKKDGKK